VIKAVLTSRREKELLSSKCNRERFRELKKSRHPATALHLQMVTATPHLHLRLSLLKIKRFTTLRKFKNDQK
jgi:hypothetical protein